MTEHAEPDIAAALERTLATLARNPAEAVQQAQSILDRAPGDARARLLLGMARRRAGDPSAARDILAPMAAGQPEAPRLHLELGLAQASLGERQSALASLTRAAGLNRALPEAWRAIGEIRTVMGDAVGAEQAFAEHARALISDPRHLPIADALCANDPARAEGLARRHLAGSPSDAPAIRLLTQALVRQQRPREALAELDALERVAPADLGSRAMRAACLMQVGDVAPAVVLYEVVLAEQPGQPGLWLSLGHALKTIGRREAAVAAYRRALDCAPGLGEAYWSLANLKTAPFTAQDVAAIRRRLDAPGLSDDDRLHLHYALGKALEDARAFEESFSHYSRGARIRRRMNPYDAAANHDMSLRSQALYSAEFFASRADWGCDSPDPIFVVGLPRAGSSLVEQILASHPRVEGAGELNDIAMLARDTGAPYPDGLPGLDRASAQAMGETYLARTQVYRRTDRPLFVDKMPNNFHHLGLIHLVLPRARIIDVRRGAMAACFAAYKHHFARGQAFSYDLADLGRYYRDYVDVMDHFDRVLPGRVHRLRYEVLVDDPEGEIRRLLAHCGLPFDPACLNFHQTARAVRTPSAEQVRRPIFRDALEQWRSYAPWLGPLRETLGPDLAE